jgi:hypothetical protein
MSNSFFDKIKLNDDTLINNTNNKCIIEEKLFENKILNLKNLIYFTKNLNLNNFESKKYNIVCDNKCNNTFNKGNIPNNSVYKKNVIKKNDIKETYYYIKQKDTLFWCFYILKNGYSNYEMDCFNNYFTIERQEKYKYIEYLRQDENKSLLKMFKIKPLLDLENDLANKDKISLKTFFGLCLIEGINIVLINNRKIYELICSDNNKINIIHCNNLCDEYYLEVDTNKNDIDNYKSKYFVMPSLDYKLKSITSYKVDELIELCNKLNINLEDSKNDKKKLLKKDIYELICKEFR